MIYQKDKLVLKDVQFKMYKGEFTFLIGKTGSGKSSLLKTLYGALPLKAGKGMVAGYDLTMLNRRNKPMLRRKLGMIFQDFNLLIDRSVAANLKFVLQATDWLSPKEMKRRINEVLGLVQLPDIGEKMPHQLSGGEQQRVAIARALLNRPELLIADEPTGNLDPDTALVIVDLLRDLAKYHNTGIVFATHDYRLIEKYPARVVRCERNTILAENASRFLDV